VAVAVVIVLPLAEQVESARLAVAAEVVLFKARELSEKLAEQVAQDFTQAAAELRAVVVITQVRLARVAAVVDLLEQGQMLARLRVALALARLALAEL
jgi:hypothetical protein